MITASQQYVGLNEINTAWETLSPGKQGLEIKTKSRRITWSTISPGPGPTASTVLLPGAICVLPASAITADTKPRPRAWVSNDIRSSSLSHLTVTLGCPLHSQALSASGHFLLACLYADRVAWQHWAAALPLPIFKSCLKKYKSCYWLNTYSTLA